MARSTSCRPGPSGVCKTLVISPRVGCARVAEEGNFALTTGAHFYNGTLGAGGDAEEGERYAYVVVGLPLVACTRGKWYQGRALAPW